MIFVTVGTHEQQFNRLIREIDHLKETGRIEDEVFIQTGYSDYEPKYCAWEHLIPYPMMQEKIRQARIVITHGGPSSFIAVLQAGKIPIVVPRKAEFGEHVNDHQVEFTTLVAQRQKNIIPVYEIGTIGDVICNYEQQVASMPKECKSNNEHFNQQLEQVVADLFR
jgi:UDP-N-acetylglucosamine transferase subunit ALG13